MVPLGPPFPIPAVALANGNAMPAIGLGTAFFNSTTIEPVVKAWLQCVCTPGQS